MSALPSFVELMSSLGLSSSGEDTRRSSVSSTPSPSCTPPSLKVPLRKSSVDVSPAIIVSHYDPPPSKRSSIEPRRRASSGSIRASRYTPYTPSVSRRGSLSTLSDDEIQRRNIQSNSSRLSLTSTIATPKEGRLTRRASQLNIVAPPSCAPISSFARRRSPHSSPTSPTFVSQRCRETSLNVPNQVSIPTLPPLIADSFAGFSMSYFVGGKSISRKDARNVRRSISPSPMEICEGESDAAILRSDQGPMRISSLCRPKSPNDGRITVPVRHISPIA